MSEMLEYANARAALVRGEASLELATDRLNDVVVRSPIDGTVVEREIEAGQIVTSTREVTGVLVYSDGVFLQILEGDEAVVASVVIGVIPCCLRESTVPSRWPMPTPVAWCTVI